MWTEDKEMIMALVPRSTAILSFCAALYVANESWQNRDRVYHRLMFAQSLHLIVWSAFHIYGTLAVPRGLDEVWGARGTTATCTLQGFFFQIAFCVPFYYVCMSVYSLKMVLSNFSRVKYEWIEKWIHIVVHIYPVGSAIYLLTIDSLNFNGHQCWIASAPYRCGDDSGVACERGPQNVHDTLVYFGVIPTLFELLFPSVVMCTLYVMVRCRQNSIKMEASAVAKQAGLYLLAFYSSYSGLLVMFLFKVADDNFIAQLLSRVLLNLQGVFVAVIYRHFRVTKVNKGDQDKIVSGATALEDSATSGGCGAKPKYSAATFNIFDGTNADGAFSQYIFDGDSDDEAYDQGETNRWQSAQNHV
eukprot:Nitzschia sp. Nitz4//scaffold231_size31564//15284//16360//NITZ4_007940-RA/size31564-processed-gene-0.36-mRNA-1//-1//CDS//3329543293//1717//frame0